MRLSTSQLNSVMLSSMQNSNSSANTQLVKIGSGKRLTTASEDPIGSVKTVLIEREQASLTQFKKNISTLKSEYGYIESQLNSASHAVVRAKELVLGGQNVSNSSQEGRLTTAAELETILHQFVDLANSKSSDGSYLFSGTKTSTKPVQQDATTGNYVYQGNDDIRQVVVSESMSVPANFTAQKLFFDGGSDIFNELQTAIDDLRDPAISDKDMMDKLSVTMKGLDAEFARVTKSITEIGGLTNSVTALNDSHEDVTLLNKNLIGEIQDLDYSEAILKLNTQMAALQATQMAYGKIQNLSLFKHM